MPTVSKVQLSIDFEPALPEQFRTFREVLAAAVYGFRGGLGAVASHCDLSPSALSRMLNFNEDDPRHLPAELVPLIVQVTGDLRPIHWLIAKFLPDEDMRRRAALSQVESMLPQFAAALATLQKAK